MTARHRLIEGMRNYFAAQRWPRISLGLVVLLTAFSGLAFSQLFLSLGMTAMWQRYPLSVAGAYGVFLALLRIWVEIERRHFDPDDPEVRRLLAERPASKTKAGDSSWFDGLDMLDIFDLDLAEGCFAGILLAGVIGIAVTVFTMLAGAPALIAEVAIDVLIVSALYRRLRNARREHWLGAAVRRTWIFAVGAAASLALIGFALGHFSPDAHTIGEAIGQFLQ